MKMRMQGDKVLQLVLKARFASFGWGHKQWRDLGSQEVINWESNHGGQIEKQLNKIYIAQVKIFFKFFKIFTSTATSKRCSKVSSHTAKQEKWWSSEPFHQFGKKRRMKVNINIDIDQTELYDCT